MSYFKIAIPVFSLLISVLAQIFAYKYILKGKLLKSIYLGCLCGLILLALCEFSVRENSFKEWLSIVIVNLLSYGALSYCYFSFINMGETARRVRLLRELNDSCAGLIKDDLLKRYNAKEIVKIRVDRLINNGQIIMRDDKYYIANPIMLLISRATVLVKLILLGKKGEFE